MQGGGVCASVTTTPMGSIVAEGGLRGQWPELGPDSGILAIGLFDGIGALRVALELLGIPVVGYVSVEKHNPAKRVVESHYPGVLQYDDVTAIDAQAVKSWTALFTQISLVVIGAGPPCQGVSGLNSDRKGALRDERSCLFVEVARIRDIVKQHFKWCPVFTLMESVASMDQADRNHMSHSIGVDPIKCDAGTFTWCHRPRLYWCDWEIGQREGFTLVHDPVSGVASLLLEGHQDTEQVIRTGWRKINPDKAFPTFTTSRPRDSPGRKPAGIRDCNDEELRRWQEDRYRFPPYQYCKVHCLTNRQHRLRIPDVEEREAMMGFPVHYTAGCVPKQERGRDGYNDCRLTLVGNSWSVPVVACLLNQLFATLGMMSPWSPQDVLDELQPGRAPTAAPFPTSSQSSSR